MSDILPGYALARQNCKEPYEVLEMNGKVLATFQDVNALMAWALHYKGSKAVVVWRKELSRMQHELLWDVRIFPLSEAT